MSHFPKTCGCGRVYATRQEWVELLPCGLMADGEDGFLSLRHCSCKSTMSVPVQDEIEVRTPAHARPSTLEKENADLRAERDEALEIAKKEAANAAELLDTVLSYRDVVATMDEVIHDRDRTIARLEEDLAELRTGAAA